ncbi:MAG: PD-(D/E)XK nuclease family protein, partial [Planctomycetaceae bacterium]|nr:PD-(D/E)XK nuclease family protein [Planctomycetaceae bacterium]
ASYHLAHSPLGPSLGIVPENFRREATMQQVALRIRSRLMTEGYSQVLHDWVAQIAPVCDARDLGRMTQLLEMASAWQKKAKIRTTPFINLVRAKRVENPSASPIKVMSIHKSKGLQFDIVILPELEAKLTGTKTPKVVVGRETPTSPVSTVLAYPAKEIRPYLPERFQKIAEQSETERVEESLCVLYVAMTRAIHELLMILMPKEESETAKKSTDKPGEGRSFAKTMAGVLHAGLAPTQSLAVEDALLFQMGDSDWAAGVTAAVPATEHKAATGHRVAEEPDVTIQLGAKPKKSSKNLTRMTPSGQEGTSQASDFRIQGSEQQRISGGADPFDPHPSPSSLVPRPSALAWGTAMHACFEQVTWLEQGLPVREMLLELVRPIMQNVASAEEVVDAFYASCGLPEVCAALSLSTYRDAIPATKRSALRWEVHNERRFWATPQPGVLLQGSIDRLVLTYDDSGIKPRVIAADVIDYKSGQAANDETLDALVAYYSPQLAEYRKAITAMYGLADNQITTKLLFVQMGKIHLME